MVNAKKDVHQRDDAIKLLDDAAELFVAKGKKVVHFKLKSKDKPTVDEMLKLVLGPTGNLRAPTLLVGKKMIVGFNEEMYQQIFG